jgi:NAD(P)-dependent dehydrogenase (short-subunit alcohol dehydrogenase family)
MRRQEKAMDDPTTSFRPDLFKGQRVLVSGATRGIGRGIARGFARLGAEVAAAGRSAADVASADDGISFHVVDARDRTALRSFVADQSGLNVLVNCAGIARPRDEYRDDVYLEVMGVNLNASMWTSTAARPLLAKTGGSIINIASMLSYLADPDVPAYCASKTGLLGLTRSLAFEFGREGIRVNAIAPGYHKTEMTRVHWENPKVAKKISDRAALKRWGTVEDVVGAALFLASPAAQFVTGTCLAVDGGYVIG